MRRPVQVGGVERFDLRYVRAGPPSGTPLLVVPGGPGMASVRPYRWLRARAAAQGLDVIMVEHRGVGQSRRTDEGSDLPVSALTVDQVVDDLAAVLDDCGVEQAVVYGTSYGSYLAQAFGARHPERVAGMVLDSVMLRADRGRAHRDALRQLLWEGSDPATAAAARTVRRLVGTGAVPAREAAAVLQVVYETAGLRRLEQLLDLLDSGRGHWTWRQLAALMSRELNRTVPGVMEFDRVGVIAFRELGYAPLPDGGPLEPDLEFARLAERFPPFVREPYDLVRALPGFTWPTAVVSGSRDLRTPGAVAREAADLVPGAVLVALDDHGHSALDTHPRAALHVAQAVRDGRHADLPAQAGRLSRLPRPLPTRALSAVLAAQLTTARLMPARRRAPTNES